jgi:hypothetical protein
MDIIKVFLILFIFVGCAGREDFQLQESDAKCSDKVCGQMSSCSEAMYNFQYCGNRDLDKDEDGEPCEELCKELL